MERYKQLGNTEYESFPNDDSPYDLPKNYISSGLYLWGSEQNSFEKLNDNYIKNQRLRPLKKYKNWYDNIKILEEESEK